MLVAPHLNASEQPDTTEKVYVTKKIIHEDMAVLVPISETTKQWLGGFYIWELGALNLNLDEDTIYVFSEQPLDFIVSEKDENRFSFPKWKETIVRQGGTVIHDDPYSYIYQSQDVTHIVAYRYDGQKHLIGKSALFGSEHELPVGAVHEILYRFVNNNNQDQEALKHLVIANAASLIQTESFHLQTIDFDESLTDYKNKHVNVKTLTEVDAFGSRRFWNGESIYAGFNNTFSISLSEASALLESYIETAQEDGVEVLFAGKSDKAKYTQALTLRAIDAPENIYSYCQLDIGGVYLTVFFYSPDAFIEHLAFAQNCQRAFSIEGEASLPKGILDNLQRYYRVDEVKEHPGFFIVSDEENNPRDFFWGAKGLMNKAGEILIAPYYEKLKYQDGMYVGEIDDKQVYFDLAGKPLDTSSE
ncbi:hypothetical protein [Grimontia celer]|nr:hypothetical protein [Grimontia celer]